MSGTGAVEMHNTGKNSKPFFSIIAEGYRIEYYL
jgi:hypothetical protein